MCRSKFGWKIAFTALLLALILPISVTAQTPSGLGISVVGDGSTTVGGTRQMYFTGCTVTSGGTGTGIVNVACSGGGGGVTWPASGDIVVSAGVSSNPTGVVPGTNVLTGLASAVNGSGGFLGFSILGTSGATLGLLNGNLTFSGNDTFSGGLILSGLSAGTQVSCLGLDSGNHVVLLASACGSGGSGLTVGTTTIASGAANTALVDNGGTLQELAYGLTGNSTLVETTSGGLLTPSILPLATSAALGGVKVDNQTIISTAGVISTSASDVTKTANYSIAATDMGGQVNCNGSGITITIPAISSTVLAANMSVTINNIGTVACTLSSTPTVNGFLGTSIPPYGGINCVSNGTSLDCVGLGMLASYVGAVNTQSGTTYTLTAADCGKTVVGTNASAITFTTFQAAVVGCNIVVEQGGAGQITFANGGSATLVSAHSYTKTFNAKGATVNLFVDVNAGSAAEFVLAGDGA